MPKYQNKILYALRDSKDKTSIDYDVLPAVKTPAVLMTSRADPRCSLSSGEENNIDRLLFWCGKKPRTCGV